jgi:hypothetical protein
LWGDIKVVAGVFFLQILWTARCCGKWLVPLKSITARIRDSKQAFDIWAIVSKLFRDVSRPDRIKTSFPNNLFKRPDFLRSSR